MDDVKENILNLIETYLKLESAGSMITVKVVDFNLEWTFRLWTNDQTIKIKKFFGSSL